MRRENCEMKIGKFVTRAERKARGRSSKRRIDSLVDFPKHFSASVCSLPIHLHFGWFIEQLQGSLCLRKKESTRLEWFQRNSDRTERLYWGVAVFFLYLFIYFIIILYNFFFAVLLFIFVEGTYIIVIFIPRLSLSSSLSLTQFRSLSFGSKWKNIASISYYFVLLSSFSSGFFSFFPVLNDMRREMIEERAINRRRFFLHFVSFLYFFVV